MKYYRALALIQIVFGATLTTCGYANDKWVSLFCGVVSLCLGTLTGVRWLLLEFSKSRSRYDWQRKIKQFHKAIGAHVGTSPGFPEMDVVALRIKLIREETDELISALAHRDLIGVIDGMCDVIVVVLGTAVSFGIRLNPFFKEVCKSNMTKVGGNMREDGKQLKPAWYRPPNLEPILNKQIENSKGENE